MAAHCFLREFDGTLLAEVEEPSVVRECTWQRSGAGQCTVAMSSSDPAVEELVHASPVNQIVARTAWDSDLEMAWWRDGLTPGTDDPTWCGPVVSVQFRHGAVEVTAFSQEWYLARSVVGGDLENFLASATPGADPDRSEWDWVSGTAMTTTTTATNLYVETAAFQTSGASVHETQFTLDDEANDNTVLIGVAVRWDALVAPSFGIAASVDRESDPAGGTSYGAPVSFPIAAPSEPVPGQWYFLGSAIRQPAGHSTRWTVQLVGGVGGTTTFGAVRAGRPQNAGARATEDWSLAVDRLFLQQGTLMPQTWTRDVDASGEMLAASLRWFSRDHEDVLSALRDVSHLGEWWVDEGVMRWAPDRGVLTPTVTLTPDDLTDWSYTVDALAAANEVVAQIQPDTGDERPQLRVSTGSGARLVRVEQVPDSMTPADAAEWTDGVLAESGPACSTTGSPVVWDGDPEGMLDALGMGDRVDVEVPADGLVPAYTVRLAVDEMSWHPVTGRVTVTWRDAR